ncbi:MAG TPA: nucleotide disphospho-sugar-binding domain-containing protein [Kofleriaceae bacterium]|nr:nucleotide disphospho-sugar-binding domain-containing protein [Kofleriaceae bacterium]
MGGGVEMSRFLFVVPPLTGHVNPTVSVARALEARGHEVAWVAHRAAVAPLLPAGAKVFPLPEHAPQALVEDLAEKRRNARGAAALKFLWEDFLVPLARSMRPGVEAAVSEFAPSVMVVDQQALAGAIVARAQKITWATTATTSAGVVDPLAGLPQVKAWLADLLASEGAPELSPHLVLAFTTPALVGDASRFPAHYRFVGPSIADRPETASFPWDALDPSRKKVLVSMGTVNADVSGRFYATAIEALRSEADVQLLVAGAEIEGVLSQRYVPQLALLKQIDAVVCHGGHNTVCETLAHARPLVIAPIKDDQPIVADQVVAAGAGLRVKFGRVQAPELRAAVRRILDEPAFTDAATRVKQSFEAAGGAAAAALALEALV